MDISDLILYSINLFYIFKTLIKHVYNDSVYYMHVTREIHLCRTFLRSFFVGNLEIFGNECSGSRG